MNYFLSLLLLGLVFGLVIIVSQPAPYFAALGLVLAAGVGCGVLAGYGGAFLSLVLFLIHLGGMLVVFAYSAALAAEPYPESLGDRSVVGYVVMYFSVVGVMAWWFHEGWHEGSWEVVDRSEFFVTRADTSGIALMYSFGGGLLVVSGWVLFLSLFVALELTRGRIRGALRAL